MGVSMSPLQDEAPAANWLEQMEELLIPLKEEPKEEDFTVPGRKENRQETKKTPKKKTIEGKTFSPPFNHRFSHSYPKYSPTDAFGSNEGDHQKGGGRGDGSGRVGGEQDNGAGDEGDPPPKDWDETRGGGFGPKPGGETRRRTVGEDRPIGRGDT